jgi:hypothetical protein
MVAGLAERLQPVVPVVLGSGYGRHGVAPCSILEEPRLSCLPAM